MASVTFLTGSRGPLNVLILGLVVIFLRDFGTLSHAVARALSQVLVRIVRDRFENCPSSHSHSDVLKHRGRAFTIKGCTAATLSRGAKTTQIAEPEEEITHGDAPRQS
jgi:hypothetical protein